MCGRYTEYSSKDDLLVRYGISRTSAKISKNYNVAPGQFMPVIIRKEKTKELLLMKWGLVPFWAKDPKIGNKLINARDETIFEKPIWRNIILKKRALIPANGFYEWKKPTTPKENKQPYYIRPKNQQIFSFAGVWETWKDVEGVEWNTYTIITTEPNKEMSPIHDRMPVIIQKEDEEAWLDPNSSDRASIKKFLKPYQDNGLVMWKVSDDINSVRNNDKYLIETLI
jgi:putative SOS response-associated peptidase YedK